MLRRSFLAGVPALATVAATGATTVLLSPGCDTAVVTSLYELSGIVSERFESGMSLTPLANARVSFVSDTGIRYETTSGGDGRYRMAIESDTPFGQVRAEAEGFNPAETTVLFDVPARRIDIDMRRAT